MNSKKKLKISIILAAVLGLFSVVSYTVFPATKPDKPIRTMFKSIAGKVMFTHKNHFAESGHGVACTDCHHHYEEDETAFKPCGECHGAELGKNVPSNCLECHKEMDEDHHPGKDQMDKACSECHTTPEGEAYPASCTECHEADEMPGEPKPMNYKKRSEAFHEQCIGCHKEKKAGPVECNSCHVM